MDSHFPCLDYSILILENNTKNKIKNRTEQTCKYKRVDISNKLIISNKNSNFYSNLIFKNEFYWETEKKKKSEQKKGTKDHQ